MDNSQTLELQIKSKAQEAKASVESLVKSLTNVENVLTNIYLEMGSIEKKTDSSINKATTATKNINQLKQSTDKATSSADKLGNAFKKVFTFAGVKRLTTTALGWTNEAIDYTEQLNLFNVVFDNTEKNGKQMFSELGKSALQFQYKMNEAFGTNKTQTLYMQGIFESMGETVGIEDKYSSIMSETMTKLTYDLASLYNKTENATAEAIRAGVYAGQTKPLRSYGIDVTQSSLQPIAESLGITESVKNMSQAEKEILRYIATLKQAKIAMGDLANTVESPSNQLKIFRQQLVEAKVALSSLFIGTFSKILPYANAILMVIKEVSKAIADMFGIELKDYNSGIASQEGIYDGIEESADNAGKAVKELKRQTLGFDEIHNISENNNSGSVTSVSGGIDQRLLDAITGYDNGMDKVRMKAAKIRDKWMEILGFEKQVNDETGEISFTYGGLSKTIQGLIDWWKKLNTQGKIFTGLGIALIIGKVVKSIKKLLKLTSITTLFQSISKKIPIIGSAITPVTTAIGTLIAGLGYVYVTNEQVRESVNNVVSSIAENLKPLLEFITNTALPNLKKAWNELLKILQPLGNFVESTFTSIWNDILIPTLQFLGDTVLPSLTKTFENLWNNVLTPLGEFITSVLKPVIDILSDVLGILWKDVIVPLSDFLMGTFKTAWESISEILNTAIIPIFNGVIEVVNWLWQNILKPIVDFLYLIFKPAFEIVCKSIGDTFDNLKQTFGGVLNFITGIFTLNWEKAWNGIKEIFSGIFNGLKDIATNVLDGIIGKLNNAIGDAKTLWGYMTTSEETGKKGLAGLWENWKGGMKLIFGKADGGVYSNGSWKDIQQYANGGAPSQGTLFWAGEAGAEVVAHANGKTEVLNQSQIASAIYSATLSAMSQAMSQYGGQSSEIDVHVHTDEGTVIDRIEQRTKQTGVFPFTIPTY